MSNETEKICTGCGRSSLNPIEEQYAACCTDNNYVIMKNETKQTAVQLYRLKSLELFKFFLKHNIGANQWCLLEEKLYDELKELENEQKRKDFTDGYMHGNKPLNHDVIDKWYNETYGGNK
jgi:hypothetical protein